MPLLAEQPHRHSPDTPSPAVTKPRGLWGTAPPQAVPAAEARGPGRPRTRQACRASARRFAAPPQPAGRVCPNPPVEGKGGRRATGKRRHPEETNARLFSRVTSDSNGSKWLSFVFPTRAHLKAPSGAQGEQGTHRNAPVRTSGVRHCFRRQRASWLGQPMRATREATERGLRIQARHRATQGTNRKSATGPEPSLGKSALDVQGTP